MFWRHRSLRRRSSGRRAESQCVSVGFLGFLGRHSSYSDFVCHSLGSKECSSEEVKRKRRVREESHEREREESQRGSQDTVTQGMRRIQKEGSTLRSDERSDDELSSVHASPLRSMRRQRSDEGSFFGRSSIARSSGAER